jgi:hypothetical protein
VHESKARDASFLIKHLAGHHFKVVLRPPVARSNVSAVEANHGPSQGSRLADTARASAEFCSRRPTLIVRLRVVPGAAFAESGNSSERKSPTLPNGIGAASLAVRYLSSGVTGLWFVKTVDRVAESKAQAQPRSRRTRMGTLP